MQYDPAHFDKLLAAAAQLPEADKVNLLSDSWALVEANRGSIADYFKLVEAVRADDNLAVWEQISGSLGYIDALYRGSDQRDSFRSYARSILKPVFDRVGWDPQPNEKTTTTLLRAQLISTLGEFADPDVMKSAHERFEKFLGDPKTLAPALRPAVFDVVARSADRKTWDQLHQLGLATKNSEEKGTYYHALTLAPAFAAETLALSLGDELAATRAARLVASVSLDGENPDLAWKFLHEHRAALAAKLDSLGRNLFSAAGRERFQRSGARG